MILLRPFVFFVCLLLATASASAALSAPQRVTGPALATLLYGREQTIFTPDGLKFHVRYDAKGVMYRGGKPTGVVVKANKTGWCNYVAGKLNLCLTIWKSGKTYAARNKDGRYAFAFIVQ
ncbi:MAG TPA: hypothetical protein VHA07_04215 [Devosia sp.]|nr:hypothetical protein [Devosia sp.]